MAENIKNFYNDLSIYLDNIDTNTQNDPPEYLPDFLTLRDEIENIISYIDENEEDAIENYRKLDCSRYPDFKTYLMTKKTKKRKKIVETSKILRTKKKITVCPQCQSKLKIINGDFCCENCQYEVPKQYSAPSTKINTNNTKHITKQIDLLCGQKKLPNIIQKIYPFITIWLTEHIYLKKWLIYTHNIQKFLLEYYQITGNYIDLTFFDIVREKIPENKFNFMVYKLFMDEFHDMLETCMKLLRSGASNMNRLENNEKLKIIFEYLKRLSESIKTELAKTDKNKKTLLREMFKIPSGNDVIEIGENVYEIGKFFDAMKIEPFYHDKTLKEKIFSLFTRCASSIVGRINRQTTADGETRSAWSDNNKPSADNPQTLTAADLIDEDAFTVPGLMFNFGNVYKISDKIPRKFNFGQEYISIINNVFNIPFIEISNVDKKKLEDLIFQFNFYYKNNKIQTKATNIKNNSPLFYCTIIYIIQNLSYFSKYSGLLDYIPDKFTNTSTNDNIKNIWFRFISDNYHIYQEYNKTTDKGDADFDMII